MALRPGRTMRKVERAYTRVSKKKPKKSYVSTVPYSRIHIFEMGNKTGSFDSALYLVSKQSAQIRSNALESARIVAHKFLERKLGTQNYFFKILRYPHHVLREKPIATGAGADRYSRGMKLAFGKPIGVAVQIREGQRLVMLKLNRAGIEVGKKALKRAASKLSATMRIEIEE